MSEEMTRMVEKAKPRRQRLREEARAEAMKVLEASGLKYREVTKGVAVFEIQDDERKPCKVTWYMTKGRLMANAMNFDGVMGNEEAIEWIREHTD